MAANCSLTKKKKKTIKTQVSCAKSMKRLIIIIIMDDRKKRIDDLERDKQEARSSLDTLLENFGENLYSRTKDIQADFEDLIQYNLYLKDIAESNTAIGKVEEKNRRFKELEEAIEAGEQKDRERSKELADIYRRLGKALLENSSYDDFTSLFREQAQALSSKLESLETRITALDNKDGGNVFSWIGKGAQGLVLRSFLSKAQESQEQLYFNIGERYSNRDSVEEESGIAAIRAEIDKLREVSRAEMDGLSLLRDEKRMISAGFGIDGNPQKQIQNLKNHIGQVREDLRNLYKNFGAQAAGIMDAEISPDRKYFIDTIVTAEDGEIIGRAVRLNQSVFDYEKAVTKLKASLAIDEENAKIEKFRRAIEDKQSRIAEFEKAIADLQESVHDSENSIQELQKQL
jgi:tetratricopeptide (TPR) repeat protein